ncbi:tetratricopeptide repeat protein [Mucilaginibacter sp. Bleaf8]|uniref:tetratricopeptide repeat protein n=1 Tax=Mucilaginibacter sp. Bleaf8 TaxID=2834430 RepID=UPI001BCE8767|nr:tetratricopeptide repeat protein [Mucilaginibacter sp. Bleaf8]MBS7565877.1 tetratricopeptide repeat protein [Mucilaginibacter sp. Bleaf8]
MNTKQIVVVVAVLGVMGYLYSLPPKGLIKEDSGHTGGQQSATAGQMGRPAAANVKVDVKMVSEPAKAAIGPQASAAINDLESQLSKASAATEKVALQQELARKWDDVKQAAPAAFYYQALAQSRNQFQDWLTAGNRFNDAYKFSQDTAMQPAFVTNAIQAFKAARTLDAKKLDAQTGLGIAYVNQTSLGMMDPEGGSPMQGITLLLDVVAKDPDNWNANLNLGQFAMKSGQYQKAVDRFKKMIAQNNHNSKLEPYFYLAESYKQLGMKQDAIAAYQQCKEMMSDDPAFGKRIDQFITELKN